MNVLIVGIKSRKLELLRHHHCPQCNLSIGRDLNAAINIKKAAQVSSKDLFPPLNFEGDKRVQLSLV